MMSDESTEKAPEDKMEQLSLSDGEAMLQRLLTMMQIAGKDQFLESIIDTILAITNASRGIVLTIGENDSPIISASKNADPKFLNSGHAGRVFQSLVELIKGTPEILMTSNVQLDPNYKPSDSLFGVTLRSIMAIPMLKDEELVGIVYIEQELRKGPFEKLGVNLTALQNLVNIASIHYKLS